MRGLVLLSVWTVMLSAMACGREKPCGDGGGVLIWPAEQRGYQQGYPENEAFASPQGSGCDPELHGHDQMVRFQVRGCSAQKRDTRLELAFRGTAPDVGHYPVGPGADGGQIGACYVEIYGWVDQDPMAARYWCFNTGTIDVDFVDGGTVHFRIDGQMQQREAPAPDVDAHGEGTFVTSKYPCTNW